ncbi:MAG: hypothetical protein U0Q15_20725 [Kineosporiaceae bacterium]
MTSDLDSPSLGDRARARAYSVDFGLAMAAYLVVLVAVLTFGGLDGDAPSRFVWALLPVLPAAWMLWAVQRHLARLDDYQRRLLLHGIAVGFGAAMLAAVTLGFLAAAGWAPEATPWLVFGAGMGGWGVASILAARR